MVVSQKYNVIDTENGLLDRSIFVDENVYQEELEKIFGRAWLFIGHESLIPNPNDFFLTYMGEDPVILTRDGKGELHAFLNMCRHRGNRIVRADDGNAKNFMCAYHGWTFSNEGKLVSVPGLQEAYYGELDVENLGLVSVAHLDTYAGFVFATWAEDAPTLEAYLGDMRWLMDIQFNRREGGVKFFGPDKWIIPNNWKNSADNFVGDNYHAILSHRSATVALAKFRKVAPPPLMFDFPGNQVSPGNGHGCYAIWDAPETIWKLIESAVDAEVLDYEKSIIPEMETRLGSLRANEIRPGHHTLFPNLSWLLTGTVRLWHPRGPGNIEVWAFTALDAAMPDDVQHKALVSQMQTFGPSGTFEQDDMDNWRSSTQAGKSRIARATHQLISMGVGHETTHEVLPGRVVNQGIAEINQRSMFVRWQEFMNAGSWGDISIDPITKVFEGSATMEG